MKRLSKIFLPIVICLITAQNAFACGGCTLGPLWFKFPYCLAWMKIFVAWNVGLFVIKLIYDRKNILRFIGYSFLAYFIFAVTFLMGFPFYAAIVIFLSAWVVSYAGAFTRREREDRPASNNAYLWLNHAVLICLIISGIFFQQRFIRGGVEYRLSHISSGLFMFEYCRKVADENLLDEATLMRMLKSDNKDAKSNAAGVFGYQQNTNAIEQLIEEMKNSDDKYFPPKPFQCALQMITEEKFDKKKEWLEWWEDRNKTSNAPSSPDKKPNGEALSKAFVDRYPRLKELTLSDFANPAVSLYNEENESESRKAYLDGYMMGVQYGLKWLQDIRGFQSISTSGAKRPKEYGYEDGIHAVRLRASKIIGEFYPDNKPEKQP